MDQLIKITNVPVVVEFKVNNAKLENNLEKATLEISRDRGGLTIKSQPIKLNIDTFEARNSVAPTTRTSIAQNAEKGKKAAYEATANFAKEGQLLLNVKLSDDAIDKIIEARVDNPPDPFTVGFLPKCGPDISYTPSNLTIEYEMDKLNFEWKVDQGDLKFIPGDIEFNIKQHPSVVIEYIGDPIYIPKSADPNYEPIDTNA